MNASTHPVGPEEIMALLDGELLADHSQSVSKHIESCADCQTIKESLCVISQKLAVWKIAAPRGLTENALAAAAQVQASNEEGGSGFIRLCHFLARRWVWAPALSAAVVLTAFLVMLPSMLVMQHKVAAPRTAVMLERVEPLDVRPYSAGQARAGGGADGSPATLFKL
jgi:anti-sigma factor RsiW